MRRFAPFATPEAVTFSVGALRALIAEAGGKDTQRGLLNLRSMGVELGVVSDSDVQESSAFLVGAGVADAFGTFAFAELTECEKPHAAAFWPALRALRVAPENAWHVGACPDRDAVGALGVGAYPIVTGDGDGPWLRVRTVADLLELIGD